MRFMLALLVAVGLVATACSTDAEDGSAAPEAAAAPADGEASSDSTAATEPLDGPEADGSEPRYVTGDPAYLFDQDELRTYELTLAEDALAFLDADPAAEEYVEGSLTFEGETVAQVGIRYKGSVGAFVGCLADPDFFNPSGEKTCTKLSMKVKLNWLDPDDTFYGLKKLQFHSQNLDDSQLRERLGYWLYREMGVPAPRSVHARLLINGDDVGLFALTEQIDGRFVRANFDDGTGNVYKEVWPVDAEGDPLPEAVYLDALETNEDEDPTASIMLSFAEALAAAGSDDEKRAVVEQYMDIEETMAHVVVDRTIRHDDGPFHFYCGVLVSECSNHNYYWYEDPSQETLHLIPWDLDNAFENIVSDVNPVTPVRDDWGEISAGCEPFAHGAFGIAQRSAACDTLVSAWVLFDAEYDRALADLLDGPLALERADAMIDTWTSQIAEATAAAAANHDDAVSVQVWDREVERLREALQWAREGR